MLYISDQFYIINVHVLGRGRGGCKTANSNSIPPVSFFCNPQVPLTFNVAK